MEELLFEGKWAVARGEIERGKLLIGAALRVGFELHVTYNARSIFRGPMVIHYMSMEIGFGTEINLEPEAPAL